MITNSAFANILMVSSLVDSLLSELDGLLGASSGVLANSGLLG